MSREYKRLTIMIFNCNTNGNKTDKYDCSSKNVCKKMLNVYNIR